MYRSPMHIDLPDIMHTTQLFNRFVELEQVDDLNASVSMGELEGVLKWFKREKILGPDGWPIEFFIYFFI